MLLIVFTAWTLLTVTCSKAQKQYQGPANIRYPAAGPYAQFRGHPLYQSPMHSNLGRVFFSNINFSPATFTITTGTTTTTVTVTSVTTCTTSTATLTTCSAGRRRRGLLYDESQNVRENRGLFYSDEDVDIQDENVIELMATAQESSVETVPSRTVRQTVQSSHIDNGVYYLPEISALEVAGTQNPNPDGRIFLSFAVSTVTSSSTTTSISTLTAICSSTTSFSACSA